MSKKMIPVGTDSKGRYPNDFIIRQNEYFTNRLRAKIFNLVDSSFSDVKQREAFKGLIRDFTADIHYSLNRDIISFLQEHKILPLNDYAGESRLVNNPELLEEEL